MKRKVRTSVRCVSSWSRLASATESEPNVDKASARFCRVGELPVLLQDVNAARSQLVKERKSVHAFHPQSVSARIALLRALEAYAAALATAGWPLPYRLRDELYMYRRLARPGRSIGR
jgi:hypothetical protein